MLGICGRLLPKTTLLGTLDRETSCVTLVRTVGNYEYAPGDTA